MGALCLLLACSPVESGPVSERGAAEHSTTGSGGSQAVAAAQAPTSPAPSAPTTPATSATNPAHSLTVTPVAPATDPPPPSPGAFPLSIVLHDHTYVYNPAMSDEFDRPALDTSKWLSTYNGNTKRLNDEWECYTENGTRRATGSSLELIGRKTGPNHAQGNCDTPNYESGLIRSVAKQKLGYFEASMRLPDGRGMWPAFWLIPGATAANEMKPPWPPEIDILEMVNNDREGPFQVSQFLHGCGRHLDDSLVSEWGCYPLPRGITNFADGDFHEFAVEWTPSVTYLYVDGVIARSYEFDWDMAPPAGEHSLVDRATCTRRDNGPAEVIINLAMGGAWPGDIDDGALPQTIEIDYVRTYAY